MTYPAATELETITSLQGLCDAFEAFAKAEDMPGDMDATEMLIAATEPGTGQAAWLTAFITRWEIVEDMPGDDADLWLLPGCGDGG